MGMSASQMRYCMISGKKSDVEYEGQQINQQRTTLATETAALNNQLLDMNVPTAPSSDSYRKTTYSYAENGLTYTVTGTKYHSSAYTVGGVTYPADSYSVNYTTSHAGDQGQVYGTGLYTYSGLTGYKSSTGYSLTLAKTTDTNIDQIIADVDAPKYYVTAGGKNINLKKVEQDATKSGYNKNVYDGLTANYGTPSGDYYYYTDTAGKSYYLTEAQAQTASTGTALTGCTYDPSTTLTGTSTMSTSAENYYTYTYGGSNVYVAESDLINNANTSNKITGYYVNSNATITTSGVMNGAAVTWTNEGRMTGLTDSSGNYHNLSTTTTADTDAYNDAMNEYDYQKEIYNQKIEQINAQLCTVQAEDKKLELKLQNLDTQQQALSTEMESVKKVIDKNIESSFKAFG